MLEEKIQNAIKELSESGRTDLCEDLIRCQGVRSPAFAQAAFKAGIFYPPILYQDASPEIRDQLIDLLEHEKADQLHPQGDPGALCPSCHVGPYCTCQSTVGPRTKLPT